ncbi:hypothetical protein PM082_004579 [Marasmius tenuissimus]|nr:hypothetical protein PM082_004579 [Marasmius tenuissimus]
MESSCPPKRQNHSSPCNHQPDDYTTTSHLVPGGRHEFDATEPYWGGRGGRSSGSYNAFNPTPI